MRKNINWGGLTVSEGDSFAMLGGKTVFVVIDTDYAGWDWDADCLVIGDAQGNRTIIDTAFFFANFEPASEVSQ